MFFYFYNILAKVPGVAYCFSERLFKKFDKYFIMLGTFPKDFSQATTSQVRPSRSTWPPF